MPSNQSRHKGSSGRQHLPGKQRSPGGQAPGKPTKQQPAPQGTPSTRPLQTTQPAPQPASAQPAPDQPSQGVTITTERGQPREEQALMQTASSTITGRPHHRKVRSIHYTLSYELQGEEHGTDGAILLLHGLPGGAFSWRNIQPVLAAKRAVYALDMLSYGKSDPRSEERRGGKER